MLRNIFTAFPAEKIVVQTFPGFIIAVGLLLYADGLLTEDLTAHIFTDTQTGLVVGFIFTILAAVLGLVLDSAFHVYGRPFAASVNWRLAFELAYRSHILRSLGLQDRDFYWVRTKEDGAIAADAEAKVLRFTELTATAGYALLLTAPGIGLYLSLQHEFADWPSMFFAGFAAVLAVFLFWLSTLSLTNFERRRTSALLDDVYALGRIDRHYDEADFLEEQSITRPLRDWWARFVGRPVIGVILALSAAYLLLVTTTPQVDIEATQIGEDMRIIVDQPDKKVPEIDLTATVTRETNGHLSIYQPKTATTGLVIVNTLVEEPVSFNLRSVTVAENGEIESNPTGEAGVIQHLSEPWRVNVSLVPNQDVRRSTEIAVQAVVTFTNDEGQSALDELSGADALTYGKRTYDIVVVNPGGTSGPSESEWLLARLNLEFALAKGG